MPVLSTRPFSLPTLPRSARALRGLLTAMLQHPMLWVAAAVLVAMLGFYVHLVHSQVMRGEETRAALRSADLKKANALTAKQFANVAPP